MRNREKSKMAAPTTKKSIQLLEMVPNDKIIFNPPFTRYIASINTPIPTT